MKWLRLAGAVAWLLSLVIAAIVAVFLAESRVGEGQASSYGTAWNEFTASWGGEIAADPPEFVLSWQEQRMESDAILKERVEVTVTESAPLPVADVDLAVTLQRSAQTFGSLTFNAFTANNVDTFRVVNDTVHDGQLGVRMDWPEGASLLNGFTVQVGEHVVTNPLIGKVVELGDLAAGAEAVVRLTWSTKGADVYTWRLSGFRDRVLPHAHAVLDVDTDEFALLRFGLDHTRVNEGGRSKVTFDLTNFSTSQDIGVRFASQRKDLLFVRQVLDVAPAAILGFLVAVFVGVQVRRQRVPTFHYLPLTVCIVSYYVFLAYLVRWLGIGPTVAGATLVAVVLAGLLVPPAFGRAVALRVVLPWLIADTVLFSSFFLLPTLTGLAVVTFLFVSATLVLVSVVRADPSAWPILAEPEKRG